MNLNTRKFYLLTSPVYVAAVGLLLLNDFVLKRNCPCWLTGKLSDFAGLFAFCVFSLIIWPQPKVLLGIGLSFALWKSPFSQPLITWCCTATGWSIGRTTDYTDLIALSVIPLAWIFHETACPAHRIEWCLASCCVSLFAFAATSQLPPPEQRAAFAAAVAEFNFTEQRPTYSLPFTRRELYQRMESLGFRVSGSTGLWPDFNKHSAYLIPSRLPQWKNPPTGSAELFEAIFDVDSTAAGLVVRLTKLEVKRGVETTDAAAAVKIFENKVIAPLRAQVRLRQPSGR